VNYWEPWYLGFDSGFGEQRKRLAARDQVNQIVIEWVGSMDRDEVLQRCLDEEVPAGKVNSIADIFEALTASDRPYKKAKTLSESIKILSHFKRNQHIDAELFDLFLTSGTYLKYAQRYLKAEQIDEVDVAQYLG
jgi:crotonobetainyl-CoA:carnitine CoA-transferase CaiB-like acyl-CoA transferase